MRITSGDIFIGDLKDLGWTGLEKRKLGKNILVAFPMEFAQQEQSGAVACHTEGHDAVVPGSLFQPCVQSILALECPSEAVTQWQK